MTFLEKVKTLEKLAELGGEDRLIDQIVCFKFLLTCI
jgi:hypothetical protein